MFGTIWFIGSFFMMLLGQPDSTKVPYPFKTWSGIGYIFQLACYGLISGAEFYLWFSNTRYFIIFSKYFGLWGSVIGYSLPWIFHLVQMVGAPTTSWNTTTASFFLDLFLHIGIGGLHGIYEYRFSNWSKAWLYAAELCEAKYGW